MTKTAKATHHHPDPIRHAFPTAGKADIHMHTTASDGSAEPQKLLDYVERHTDLDVIAITDHDTIDGALEVQRLHSTRDYRFDVIIGEEVTSTAGHILALFIKEHIPKELSPEETVKRIHAQGGLAIAAHPLLIMKYINPEMLTADGVGIDVLMNTPFDGIEIINGTPMMRTENRRIRLLNRTILFRAETGGSDAHIVEAVGKAYTLFPGRTAEDLRTAIEQKTTEPVSARYHVIELLKYLKFFLKEKVRETGKRIFGRSRRIKAKSRREEEERS